MSSHMVEVTTAQAERLPRYRRATTAGSCVLTRRDLTILRLVESFRLLTSEHLRHLAPGSGQGILRRLQALFHAGYLDRLRPHRVENGGSAKMVYAITNKGVQTLQKEGLIQNPSKTDRNAQNRELGDIHIAHTLLISSVRAMLTAACTHHSGLELLFWREGRELLDTIEVVKPAIHISWQHPTPTKTANPGLFLDDGFVGSTGRLERSDYLSVRPTAGNSCGVAEPETVARNARDPSPDSS